MTGNRIFVSIILMVSFLQAQQPEWIGGRSRKYTDQLYLVGVGSGSTREAAESQARANIGRIFKVEIKSKLEITREEKLQQKEGQITGEGSEKTLSKVDVGAAKTLEGTEIVDVWHDKENKIFYALAVLERQRATAILQQRVQEVDSQFADLSKSIRQSTDRLEKLRMVVRKKTLLALRRDLNADYRIVNPTGRGIVTPYSLEKENAEIEKFLKQEFALGIEGKGEQVDGLVQAFSKYLSGRGFGLRRVTEKNKSMLDVIITLDFSMDPAKDPVDDWYYCPWRLDVQAVDQNSGRVLISDTRKGRASQLSVAGAKKRTVHEASRNIQALAAALTEGLLGE